MRSTCLFTVGVLIPRMAAISSLDFPKLTQCSTDLSRVVSGRAGAHFSSSRKHFEPFRPRLIRLTTRHRPAFGHAIGAEVATAAAHCAKVAGRTRAFVAGSK